MMPTAPEPESAVGAGGRRRLFGGLSPMRHRAVQLRGLGLAAAILLAIGPGAFSCADEPRGIYLLSRPLESPAARDEAAEILSDLTWSPLHGQTPERIVLLIHGLDELGGIWDDLAPALQEAGHVVARFEYPNDEPIPDSASLLAGHLRDLRRRGTGRIDIVAHSMGGLVARDCLTRPGLYAGEAGGHDDLPAIERLITLGTPNHGSPLARFRAVLEVRERLARAYETDNWRALNPADPEARRGLAGPDLLPGSEFLRDLNERPLPRGVRWSIIAARLAAPEDLGLGTLAHNGLLAGAIGPQRLSRWAAAGELLAADVGDGVVPLSSTPLAGVEDYVVVEANHRSLVKRIEIGDRVSNLLGLGGEHAPPPAIPLVLERLARPGP